jgi:hypothetical protein
MIQQWLMKAERNVHKKVFTDLITRSYGYKAFGEIQNPIYNDFNSKVEKRLADNNIKLPSSDL